MKATLSCTVLAAGVIVAAGLMPAEAAAQSVSVDRWLVSDPFPVDTIGDPLGRDHLAAGGEGFILPDRGRELGGTSWTLVRDDGATSFSGLRGDDPAGRSVVYANAYVKSPADQTVRLTWSVSSCAGMSLLLNGQTLAGDGLLGSDAGDGSTDDEMRTESAWVRIGYGWNTIMAKVSADCRASFGASLDGSWPDEDGPTWPEGIRVQASRPPGDLRMGPEPWIVLSPAIGPVPYLDWIGDRLTGNLRLRLSGWGAVPLESVRLKSRTGGEDAELVVLPGSPAAPTDTLIEVGFSRLRKAGMKRGASRIEIRWPDEKLEMDLDVPASAVLAAFHGPIRMLGWGPGPDDPGPKTGDEGKPPSAGRVLRGSWVVPDALEGFSLLLDVTDSPGSWRLELQGMDTASGTAPLCAPCRKGTRMDLFVTVAEDWSGWPVVRVTDPGYEDKGDETSAGAAVDWLRLLDDNGSAKYRERGLEAGQ